MHDRERHGPQVSATTRTVETRDGARLHVVDHSPETGLTAGTPTVVLAHGWTLDHTTWDPVVVELQSRRRVRVVSYDQPGHGRSSLGRRRGATVKGLGEALRDVISAAVPTGPLVLAGHSMGGMTVMAYAGAHPGELHERTRGALLVATSPEIASLRKRIPGERVVMGLQSLLPEGTPALPMSLKMIRSSLFGQAAQEAHVREVRRIINDTRATTTGRYFAALMGHDEITSLDMLVGVPTVVMAGQRDRLTPARWSRKYHERIPGATLDVVDGAGHMLTYEATSRVADHLESLLDGTAIT